MHSSASDAPGASLGPAETGPHTPNRRVEADLCSPFPGSVRGAPAEACCVFESPARSKGMSILHALPNPDVTSTTTPEPGESLITLTKMAEELVADLNDTLPLLQTTLAKIHALAGRPDTHSKQLLTLADVEALLGVSRTTVHRLTHPGPGGSAPDLPVVMFRGVNKGCSQLHRDSFRRSLPALEQSAARRLGRGTMVAGSSSRIRVSPGTGVRRWSAMRPPPRPVRRQSRPAAAAGEPAACPRR